MFRDDEDHPSIFGQRSGRAAGTLPLTDFAVHETAGARRLGNEQKARRLSSVARRRILEQSKAQRRNEEGINAVPKNAADNLGLSAQLLSLYPGYIF